MANENVVFKTSINKTIDDLLNWDKITGTITPKTDVVPITPGTIYFTSDGHIIYDLAENQRIWMGKNAYSAIYTEDINETHADIANTYLKRTGGLLEGSGTAATSASEQRSGDTAATTYYYPALWRFNITETPKNGDIIVIKTPVAGHDNGVFISLDYDSNNPGQVHYQPVIISGTTRLTTQYEAGTSLVLIYEANTTASSVYNIGGSKARVNITGAWRVLNYYDTNTLITYGTIAYYFRPYTAASLSPYQFVVINKDNKVVPLSTTVFTNYSSSTTYAKDVYVLYSNKFYKSLQANNKNHTPNSSTSWWSVVSSIHNPTQVAFKPDKIYWHNSATAVAIDNVMTANTLMSNGYNATTMSVCNFNSSIPAYRMIYLCGTYDKTTGLFTLRGGGIAGSTQYYTLVYNNINNITLSSYFTSGYDYILLGSSYSSVDYIHLREDHPMYHFDGTNLLPYDTYDINSHIHGNIQNNGTLQTNDITIANGDKLIVTDSSDSSKVARTSITFDGSTSTKALTQKGTWETFNNYSHPTTTAVTAAAVKIGKDNLGHVVIGSALTKSDIGLSNVENTKLSTWAGTNNITTLGTITTGTWNGNTIDIAHGGTNATTAAGAWSNIVAPGGIITGNLQVNGNTNFTNETSIDSATVNSLIVNGNTSFVQSPVAPTPESTDSSNKLATTEFVYNILSVADAMIFKGVVNSANDLPTTHNAGWTYKVATAGAYAGTVCEVGDLIICIQDGTTNTNSHWHIIQTNIDGAVTGPASSIDGKVALFNGTSGKIIKQGTISNQNVIKSITFGTGSTPTLGTAFSVPNVTGNTSVTASKVTKSDVSVITNISQANSTSSVIGTVEEGILTIGQAITSVGAVTSQSGTANTVTISDINASKVTLGTAFLIPNITNVGTVPTLTTTEQSVITNIS